MSKPTIYIAAGHGGNDPGAVSGKYIEKALTLKTALACQNYLRNYECETVMARTTDKSCTVAYKMEEVEKKRPSLVLEIHYNAGGGEGCEVYYWHTHAPSESLAQKVLAEMVVEIQVPGVRVVADPLFTTMGSFMSNDIIESVNSQIKAKAKFVGNPDMKSSQIIEIKNVGKKYSGDWYAKEVEHSFDTGGYFTEVTFEKKSRNSILNRISTSVNTQEVFQKAHDIAEESYTTGAWKIPSKIKAEVARYRASTWTEEDKENPQRAGRQIVVRQNPDNPADYKVEVDSRIDFQVGRNISPRE